MRRLQTAGGATLSAPDRPDPALPDASSPDPGPPDPHPPGSELPDPAGQPAPDPPATAGSGRRARLLLVGLAAGAVLLDQVSKQLTVAELADSEPVRLLGGALYLVHTTNSGAAFSLGSSYTWVFPLVAFAVIGWIGWMARRLCSTLWAVALGLVLGGATGNLVDRLAREPGPFRGAVVDMISVFAPDGSVFPVFNLADSSLVLGVLLAVWLELTGRRRDGTRVTSRPAPAGRGG